MKIGGKLSLLPFLIWDTAWTYILCSGGSGNFLEMISLPQPKQPFFARPNNTGAKH